MNYVFKTGSTPLVLHARFMTCVSFSVSEANSSLTVNGGFLAVHASGERQPHEQDPPWSARQFTINGGEGVGTLEFDHLVPKLRNPAELLNEHSRLSLFEFDTTQDRTSWLSDSGWQTTFTPPFQQANGVGEQDKSSLDRFNLHRLTLGDTIRNRWVHHVDPIEQNGGLEAISLSVPLVERTLTGRLLAASSFGGTTRYAPKIVLNTYYGHDEVDAPDAQWQHFDEPTPARLTGNVEGFVLIASGVFRSERLDEINDWADEPGLMTDPNRLFRKLRGVVAKRQGFERTLASVEEYEQSSVAAPKKSGLPIEVLHLKGLKSPRYCFGPVEPAAVQEA